MIHCLGGKSSLADCKLPIGKAMAQPRINVSEGSYSPYSVVRVTNDEHRTPTTIFNNGAVYGNNNCSDYADQHHNSPSQFDMSRGSKFDECSDELKPLNVSF